MVPVLCVAPGSYYLDLANCDCYTAERDAFTWRGGSPCIAHPPCAQWGGLYRFANDNPVEKSLGPWCVNQVRLFGGVLEHLAHSKLWKHCGLPPIGSVDEWAGFTLQVSQMWWGHRAEKKTWLYVVGLRPAEIPPLPQFVGRAKCTVGTTRGRVAMPEVTKRERHATPPALALWLIDLVTRIAERRTA